MSEKELTPLEALKLLYGCVRCENSLNLEICSSARETIEKELKEYEQYKAIEDELGIDLLNFSKILFALDNETVYVKEMIYKQYDGYGCFEETGKIERHCIVRFSRAINGNRDWFFIVHFGYNPNEYLYRLQDYGKTWALTKEELVK